MWSFQTLSRPTYNGGFGGIHGYNDRMNRADGGSTESKSDRMVNVAIHKGVAVVTSGLAGMVSAYKGMPEIKGFMGLDLMGGLLGSAAEFIMLWKGMHGKGVAALGGFSTGLLCHYSAVQGTILGATKSKADTSTKGEDNTETGNWDYDKEDRKQIEEGKNKVTHEPPKEREQVRRRSVQFEEYHGSF